MTDYHAPDRDRRNPVRSVRLPSEADNLRLQAVLDARGLTLRQFVLEAIRAAETGTLQEGAVTLGESDMPVLETIESWLVFVADRHNWVTVPGHRRQLTTAASWARARLGELDIRRQRRWVEEQRQWEEEKAIRRRERATARARAKEDAMRAGTNALTQTNFRTDQE